MCRAVRNTPHRLFGLASLPRPLLRKRGTSVFAASDMSGPTVSSWRWLPPGWVELQQVRLLHSVTGRKPVSDSHVASGRACGRPRTSAWPGCRCAPVRCVAHFMKREFRRRRWACNRRPGLLGMATEFLGRNPLGNRDKARFVCQRDDQVAVHRPDHRSP